MVATLIEAPPFVAPNLVGRLLTTVPVIDADGKAGFGVVYERDVQVNGTATWPGPCEAPGATKTADEVQDTVTGIPFTVWQMSKCRMLNEWDRAGGRLRTLFEAGEIRTVETAFATALAAGSYGTVTAGPAATDGSALATYAIAEQFIADAGSITGSYVLASPEITTYAISRNIIVRVGDNLETHLGTPVISLVGLGDDLYVTGPITVWKGALHPGEPVQISPYDNEFTVLAERVYTIAVEADGGMGIVKWTVDLTI